MTHVWSADVCLALYGCDTKLSEHGRHCHHLQAWIKIIQNGAAGKPHSGCIAPSASSDLSLTVAPQVKRCMLTGCVCLAVPAASDCQASPWP